jgi:hypothetical protein
MTDPSVPDGCRDPRLWLAAAELLAGHDAESCVSCRRGVPCTVLSSAADAQSRAMRAAPEQRVIARTPVQRGSRRGRGSLA